LKEAINGVGLHRAIGKNHLLRSGWKKKKENADRQFGPSRKKEEKKMPLARKREGISAFIRAKGVEEIKALMTLAEKKGICWGKESSVRK